MKNLLKAGIVGAAAFPLLAFAQATEDLFDFFGVLTNLLGVIAPFVIGLAVLVILWGVFTYIAGAGDEEKRATSKLYIIWGILGLFVMVAIWGLVGIVSKTANFAPFTATSPQIVPGAAPGGAGGVVQNPNALPVRPLVTCFVPGTTQVGRRYTDGTCRP